MSIILHPVILDMWQHNYRQMCSLYRMYEIERDSDIWLVLSHARSDENVYIDRFC